MMYTLHHKSDGSIVVSDGLHRVVLDAPIVQALAELVSHAAPGLVATPTARPLLVVPLAAETTAHGAQE